MRKGQISTCPTRQMPQRPCPQDGVKPIAFELLLHGFGLGARTTSVGLPDGNKFCGDQDRDATGCRWAPFSSVTSAPRRPSNAASAAAIPAASSTRGTYGHSDQASWLPSCGPPRPTSFFDAVSVTTAGLVPFVR